MTVTFCGHSKLYHQSESFSKWLDLIPHSFQKSRRRFHSENLLRDFMSVISVFGYFYDSFRGQSSPRNSAGSIISPSFETLKCRCAPRPTSVRDVLPTLPSTAPAGISSPARTLNSGCKLA